MLSTEAVDNLVNSLWMVAAKALFTGPPNRSVFFYPAA